MFIFIILKKGFIAVFNNGVKSIISGMNALFSVSGQLPRRTIPHHTGFGPEEWFYSVVVVLVGSCPGGE